MSNDGNGQRFVSWKDLNSWVEKLETRIIKTIDDRMGSAGNLCKVKTSNFDRRIGDLESNKKALDKSVYSAIFSVVVSVVVAFLVVRFGLK